MTFGVKENMEKILSNIDTFPKAIQRFGENLILLRNGLQTADEEGNLPLFDKYLRKLETHYTQVDDVDLCKVIEYLEQTSRSVFPKLSSTSNPLITLTKPCFQTIENASGIHFASGVDTLLIELPYLHENSYLDCYTLAHEIGHIALFDQLDYSSQKAFHKITIKNEIDTIIGESDSLSINWRAGYNWIRELTADGFSVNSMGPIIPAIFFSNIKLLYWKDGLTSHPPNCFRLLFMLDRCSKILHHKLDHINELRDLRNTMMKKLQIDLDASIEEQLSVLAPSLEVERGSSFDSDILFKEETLLSFIHLSDSLLDNLKLRSNYQSINDTEARLADTVEPKATAAGFAARLGLEFRQRNL